LDKQFGETVIVGANQLTIPSWKWPAR
jgi:hypothetical protein